MISGPFLVMQRMSFAAAVGELLCKLGHQQRESKVPLSLALSVTCRFIDVSARQSDRQTVRPPLARTTEWSFSEGCSFK